MVDRLARKHKAVAKWAPAPIIETQPGATVGLVTLGGCDAAVREALVELGQRGLRADYMRVRAFPFDESVERFLESHARNFIIEQNRDGQLRTLLVAETPRAQGQARVDPGLRRFPAQRQTRGRRGDRRAWATRTPKPEELAS